MALCLLLAVAGCVTSQPETVSTAPEVSEEAVAQEGAEAPAVEQGEAEIDEAGLLELASQDPAVTSFIAENPDYAYEVTALSPEDITGLAEKYPVIYGNLPGKTLYRIDYKDGRGILVIVDLEGGAVLRSFRTAGVSLE